MINQTTIDPLIDKEILIGICTRDAYQIHPIHKIWFDKWYEKAYPDPNIMEKIDANTLEKLRFVIIAGSWCKNCRTDIPVFYRILDVKGLKNPEILSIYVDRKKTVPGFDLTQYAFEQVPAIIVIDKRSETEIGRIEGNPVKSVEEDLLQIIEKLD